MTHEEMKAMVEKLKTTWTVVGGLTLDEKVFIEQHIRQCVEVDLYGIEDEAELPIRIGMLVRLRADFVLPEPEKWYFNAITKTCMQWCDTVANNFSSSDMIEITPEDKDYIEKKHEGYELRKTNVHDNDFITYSANTPFGNLCIRWCRIPVEKKSRMVEYAIRLRDNHFYECGVTHIPDMASLHELQGFKGFLGFRIAEKEGVIMQSWPCMIDCEGIIVVGDEIQCSELEQGLLKLCTPVAAVFQVEEKQ